MSTLEEMMNRSQRPIQNYESLQKTGCNSLMSAMSENQLTAAIGLTGSNLTGNFMSRDAMDQIKERALEFQKNYKGDANAPMSMLELLKHPAMREQAALIETLTHEMTHCLQKHAYQSVFTLVEALQTIESAELLLAISHASQGGSWRIDESYLQGLKSFGEELGSKYESRINNAAGVALEAYSEHRGGLGLLHLIEGQAHVAARISVKTFDALGVGDVPQIYTLAWEQYSASGGTNPFIFVLLTGASLRYGAINDDIGGSFRGFLPHPVDVFLYLLNYVPELEAAIVKMDGILSSPLFLTIYGKADIFQKASKLVESSKSQLTEAIGDKRHLAADSEDEDFSFLRCKESPDDFDNEEEMDRLRNRLHRLVCTPLQSLKDAPKYDTSRDAVAAMLLGVDMLIADIIENTYTRLADPLDDAFDRPAKGKIAAAVGKHFIKAVPDYCNSGIFHRLMLDQEFTLGKLVWFFLNEMRDEVEVQPFDQMEPMLYFEYQGLRQVPEAIKKILDIAQWRAGRSEAPESGPYCCELHGCLPVSGDVLSKLQSCTEEDSTGQLVHHFLRRTVHSLFQGI